jgi:FAD/FMN-containing dehydrogenase
MPQGARPEETLEAVGESLDPFADRLRGDLVGPDDEAYDATRTVWNGLVDAYPAVVVRCAGAADVAEAVTFAREHDLSLSVHSAGHHEAGTAVAGELVVDVSGLDSVQVDPASRTVRVEPGARAGDLHHETSRLGLAAPTGSADAIGIGGSTLGGGIGWIRRAHGLGIDALRSVEVVTADGQLRHASPEHDPDLFWGIRGAGGNFGVVTALEFDLFPVGPEVMTLGVFYPGDRTREVVDAHREVMADAPEALTTILVRGHVPPLPMVPDHARGADAVGILGCCVGDVETGREVVAPLRDVAEPVVDLSGPMPYPALHGLGSQLYPDGRNYCWRSSFAPELTDDLIDVVVEAGETLPSPLSAVSVWPLGGAMSEPAPDDTAFRWRDHDYLLVAEANWEGDDDGTNGTGESGEPDDTDDAHVAWARETDARFRERGAEGAYAGLPGLGDTDEDVGRLVYGDNYGRLARLKREYDPENLFARTTNVPPADGG